MPKIKRGEIWELDFTPQSYRSEPGKQKRPALVIQTDILNDVGHSTAVVIPGTSSVYRDAHGDGFPLRVPIGLSTGRETDLLIDQIRAVSTERFMGKKPLCRLSSTHIKRVESALNIILGKTASTST